jgi:putative Mn2+ efflux pump MntP
MLTETLFLAGSLSINNIGLAIAGGIGGIDYASAAASIFCFSVVMLALGQAVGTNFIRLKSLHRVLRHPMVGNGALALFGVFILAGYQSAAWRGGLTRPESANASLGRS